MSWSRSQIAGGLIALAACVSGAQAAAEKPDTDYLQRPPEDEVIYFVLPDRFENGDTGNDRGGFEGDRLTHGFDPTHKGFFNGGDLKGLTKRLDYIEKLGATAIWLGPIYKNKPVQGGPGEESAGYHGYWITDFTRVDPHFGTNEDLKTFVDAAHARGIKIYLDIITNHTADVIAYRECHDTAQSNGGDKSEGCAYRSKSDYPYATRGDADGEKINAGFMGDQPSFQTPENFSKLTRADYAYTPFVSEAEKDIKVPAWLNDPIYYHNRGDSFWIGESSRYGDFAGLDDLLTEHPRVLDGMIEIFGNWIEEYKIDGFRIDTAKHVSSEFWGPFTKAMLERAEAAGIPNFYIFGEAYEPDAGRLARFTRVDGFPTVLDFAFQSAVTRVVAKGEPAQTFADLFYADALHEGGEATARKLPVFIGNHDMGRFAMFVRQENPDLTNAQIFERVRLAHAMMFFLRGAPVIYYGDEQGFNGDGNDQASRETMFPSRVESYNDNDLIGSSATTADENFDTKHPLFKAIAKMASLYHDHPPLRRGAQTIRKADHDSGFLAVSRSSEKGGEYLIAFNASDTDRSENIDVDPRSTSWKKVAGSCARRAAATGNVRVTVPAWGYVICKSNEWDVANDRF